MSKFRHTDPGDAIEARKAMLDLQKQLNERAEVCKLFQVENRRLHQHIKGLESKLLRLACPAMTCSSSDDSPAVPAGRALLESWSKKPAKPCGSLKCSTAGDASALRVFKEAAMKAKSEAVKASTALLSTQQQLQQTEQKLQQVAADHGQLQERYSAVQQHTVSSDASIAALQEQLQRLQQVLQVKQQDILHMQQQLQQLTAQRQVQQESSKTAHQQEVQQLQMMHAAELDRLKVSCEMQSKADCQAVQETLNTVQQQLTGAEQAIQYLRLLRQGLPGGWTCCISNSCNPCHAELTSSRKQCTHCSPSELGDGIPHLHLQVLLYSISCQPGLLGISKQDWCPLLLVHIINPTNTLGALETDGQLLTAIAARSSLQTPAKAITCPVVGDSGTSLSAQSGTAADEPLQHLLQLQIPRELDAPAVDFMSNGKLQLSVMNAKSALVGLFKVVDTQSSNSADTGSHTDLQLCVMAVLIFLGISGKCWAVGLYEAAADNKPGCFLGLLSSCDALSQANSNSNSCSCIPGRTEKAYALLSWKPGGAWLLPELAFGEFLVPPCSSTPSVIPEMSLPTPARFVKDPCPLYAAALNSGLFSKTNRTAVLHRRTNAPTKGVEQGSECDCKVICDIWTLQSAAARAAVSQAVRNKDLHVASEPWQGASAVLAAATVPVSPAIAADNYEEVAAKAQQQVLDSHSSFAGKSSLGIQSAEDALLSSFVGDVTQVDLMHSRGKSVTQVQLSLRYNHPVKALLHRYAKAQHQKALHDQLVAEWTLRSQQTELRCSQQETIVQQQQVELDQKDQQLQTLQNRVTCLEADLSAERHSSSQELAELKQKSAVCADEYQIAAARHQKRIDVLTADNEQLQQIVEQQLQQLDELDKQLKTSEQQQAPQVVQHQLQSAQEEVVPVVAAGEDSESSQVVT